MQRFGLHQNTLKFDCLQQLTLGLDLTTGIGAVGGRGNRHAQALGVEAHLGNETRCAGVVHGEGALKDFTIADQGLQLFCHTRLGRYPVAQQAFKTGTSGWASTSRNVESEGDLPKSVPSSSLSVCRCRLA